MRSYEIGEIISAGWTKHQVRQSETAFLKNKGKISETTMFWHDEVDAGQVLPAECLEDKQWLQGDLQLSLPRTPLPWTLTVL